MIVQLVALGTVSVPCPKFDQWGVSDVGVPYAEPGPPLTCTLWLARMLPTRFPVCGIARMRHFPRYLAAALQLDSMVIVMRSFPVSTNRKN